MGRPVLSASLFVGSLTQRTMFEWLKIFKIVDNESLIKEIKQSFRYINEQKNGDNYRKEPFTIRDCFYYIDFTPHMKKLEDFLEKAKLIYGLDYMYQEEEFYIGRTLENVREDISSDILFWQQYEIKDIDIFSAMYSERGGIEYSMTREEDEY